MHACSSTPAEDLNQTAICDGGEMMKNDQDTGVIDDAMQMPVKTIETSRSRAGIEFLLVFLLLAAGLVATGYFYYQNYQRHYRAEVGRQLSAIG